MKNTFILRKTVLFFVPALFFGCKENLDYALETPAASGQIPTVAAAKPSNLYGLDISKWNGDEAMEIDANDSISFIICKATRGLQTVDVDFKTNVAIIRNKKIILGTYHFFSTGENPVGQAQHYWNTIEGHNPDMLPVVDIEDAGLSKNKKQDTPKKIQDNLAKFLNELESKCNCSPMIYTSVSFANQYLNNPVFSKYPLWLAEYTNAKQPKIPKAWNKKGFMIWQKSESYDVHSHPTDFDVFYGKKDDLLHN